MHRSRSPTCAATGTGTGGLQEAVFAIHLAGEKIGPEVVENMATWPHSGFSVHQSVYLPPGDRAGIERSVCVHVLNRGGRRVRSPLDRS